MKEKSPLVTGVVVFIACVSLSSALGYWLGGHSFAERGRYLMEWYLASIVVSAFVAVMSAMVATIVVNN